MNKIIKANTSYINLKAGGITRFFGISRSDLICSSIASQDVTFIFISLAFNDIARHAEAEVIIGRGVFDFDAINILVNNLKYKLITKFSCSRDLGILIFFIWLYLDRNFLSVC